MTTRRIFLKTLAALPPVLGMPMSRAEPGADPSRLALVIGNNAYKDSPLENPVNDARGMSKLFTQAGFTVNSLLNAKRNDMLGAIDLFGESIGKPEIKLVVFYYAGHGVQLDWHNYLLPVDATVSSAEDIKSRCVGLNAMLGQLGKASNKTFIIILDACRNNPFGRSLRIAQQGLSQFDAPNNSLLAYATAPGNVAADGSSSNGLYTEHLIRELSAKGTRFEDALKRVRTNVRIASQGTQVPWESTSLEADVFLFRNAEKKLTASEVEAAIEAEFTAWSKIKASRNLDDLAAYLRAHPDGRFSEIVQSRVAEILDEEKQRRAQLVMQAPPVLMPSAAPSPAPASLPPPAPPAPGAAPAPLRSKPSASPVPSSRPPPQPPAPPPAAVVTPLQAIYIAAGKSVQILPPSDNPYSAGTFPLNRIFTVGDKVTFQQSDLLTEVVERTYTVRVTAVDKEAGTVELNNGKRILDLMGNIIKDDDYELDSPLQIFPAEVQVGRKWKGVSRRTSQGVTHTLAYNMEVVKREKISVPAGEFDTFMLVAKGWNETTGSNGEIRTWVVPGLNFYIRYEKIVRTPRRTYHKAMRRELVSLHQQAFKSPVTT